MSFNKKILLVTPKLDFLVSKVSESKQGPWLVVLGSGRLAVSYVPALVRSGSITCGSNTPWDLGGKSEPHRNWHRPGQASLGRYRESEIFYLCCSQETHQMRSGSGLVAPEKPLHMTTKHHACLVPLHRLEKSSCSSHPCP